MKRLSKIIGIIILLILMIVCFSLWQNNTIVISQYDYVNSKIPSSFDGFKIAQISDLHNQNFGTNQSKLLDKLSLINPDIIFITGDLVDYRKYKTDGVMSFIDGAIDIAPIYYVSGNHEAWSNKYDDLKTKLLDAGVIVLDNQSIELSKENSSIILLGLSDPDFLTNDYFDGTDTSTMENQLSQWSNLNQFKILLSHRPELFHLYSDHQMDLIFTGHAHGGQIRLPLIKGLIAPDQGIFPKYTSGTYTKDLSTMFVSRGLGNSVFPIRIFNPPEIVVVCLKTSAE